MPLRNAPQLGFDDEPADHNPHVRLRIGLIADCTIAPIGGGPHNVGWPYSDEVNAALLTCLSVAR
jgi:hypothetical protein